MIRKISTICLAALIAGLAFGPGPLMAQTGGTIKGVVQYKGAAPGERWLQVTKNPDVCGNRVPDEALLASPDGGLKNVVLSVEGVPESKAPPAEIAIDNKGCVFAPHVQTAIRGGNLLIKSTDAVLHNTHIYLGDKTILNVSLAMQGSSKKSDRALLRSGLLKITCDAHPWMSAYIYVFDHGYASITDGKGAFEIKDVPPGSYKLKAWHEGLGEAVKEVSVQAGKVAEVAFLYSK